MEEMKILNLENKIKFDFMTNVTFTRRINYTKFNLGYGTVDDVVKIIREGNILMNDYEIDQYSLKWAIEYIRSLNTHAEQQQWKERLLPAVAYNGVFSEVEESHIMQYSNVTAMDFDDIEGYNEMRHLWRRLVITPCVYSVFVTPSGGRLKALVLHDNTNPNNHRDLYEQLLAKFNISNPDTSCRDLASYAQTGKTISDRSIISIMNSVWKKNNPEYWQEGHRACSIFYLACKLCRWGVEEDLALEYFIKGWESDTMTEDEITGHVTNAYKTEKDNFGTVEFTFYK